MRADVRAELDALRAWLGERGIRHTYRADDENVWFDWEGIHVSATWNDAGSLNAALSGVRAAQFEAALEATCVCTMEPADGWDEDMGVHTCSRCGEPWMFDVEGPEENGWRRCPRCGASISYEGGE